MAAKGFTFINQHCGVWVFVVNSYRNSVNGESIVRVHEVTLRNVFLHYTFSVDSELLLKSSK